MRFPHSHIVFSDHADLDQKVLKRLQRRLRPAQLTQRDDLSYYIPVPVDQDRRRVPFRVVFDAHVRPDLAELDLAEPLRQLPPQLGQDARLHVRVRRGRQVHRHEGPGTRLGDVAGVVGLLERVDLPVDAVFGQAGQFLEAFAAVGFQEGVVLVVFEVVELVERLVFKAVVVGALVGFEQRFLDHWFGVCWLFGDHAVFAEDVIPGG